MDARQRRQTIKYRELADRYDRKFRRENANHLYKIESIVQVFEANLPEKGCLDFLEVGAGTGIHADHFRAILGDRIRSFVLSDLSPEMLAQAERRLGADPRISYRAVPAENVGATDGRFDGIYVSGAMHHFSAPFEAVAGMASLLKPGGTIVVCEPNVSNPLNFVMAAKERAEWGQFVVRPRAVRAALERAGLEIVENRVLHWKADQAFIRRLWPYRMLEKVPLLDSLAVMFLIGARAGGDTRPG